jgi:hypothetical protein
VCTYLDSSENVIVPYVHPVFKLGLIIALSGSLTDKVAPRMNSTLICSSHSLGGASTCSCQTSGGERKCDLEGAESTLQLPPTAGPHAASEVATNLVPRTHRPLGLSGSSTGHGLNGKSRNETSHSPALPEQVRLLLRVFTSRICRLLEAPRCTQT